MNSLTRKEKQELILDLIEGFVSCKTIDEAVIFLEDLITKKELEMLAKRLRIAKLLIEGFDYRDIQDSLHVSHGTIAKVSYWLTDKGEGFRRIVKKLPKRENQKDPLDYNFWEDIKNRYPSYFLPELIIESISRNKKEKENVKARNLLNTLDNSLRRKSKINKEIKNQLSEPYKRTDR